MSKYTTETTGSGSVHDTVSHSQKLAVKGVLPLLSNAVSSRHRNPHLASPKMPLLLLAAAPSLAAAACTAGCPLALGSYYVSNAADIGGIALNLTFIASLFSITTPSTLRPYNPSLSSLDPILTGSRVNIFFPCSCFSNRYLAANFPYKTAQGDTYTSISSNIFANLTSDDALADVNSYSSTGIPNDVYINVTVNCSCGDASVSEDYGLFETYPLREGQSLRSVAAEFNLPGEQSLLQKYNPGVNFSKGQGIVFVPARDPNGSYLPLQQHKSGSSVGVIAGIVVAVVVSLVLAICLYFGVYKRKKKKSSSYDHDNPAALPKTSVPLVSLTAYTAERSVEFSYEELAKATDEFSMSNEIGVGGFGVVYYAELRGEKAAIKKMDMQATNEFLSELEVLTHVHHLNLVRLIGYCMEGFLFLVYEFIDNGDLSQHLRGPGRDPLSWSSRVQIALDSARGLEYIHEHTVQVYIHRDIKSANILIDKNFHAKVADFGLAKLAEVDSMGTRIVGTFGYMAPEYAQYGDLSPKVDVFAFGIVLYELISGQEAIVRRSDADSKKLVAYFEESMKNPDQKEELLKLVDPRLGNSYPPESVFKMAHLAKACTHENPQQRPAMRSIINALMALSSSIEEWDLGSFYENRA